MNCESQQAQMVEWLAGELDAAAAARLANHVRQCGECRDELDRLTRLWHDLGVLPSPEPPAGAAAAFRAALSHRAAPRWPSRLQTAALLAALLLGATMGYAMGRPRRDPVSPAGQAALRPAAPEFLLLLQDAPGRTVPPAQAAAIVREYGAWAAALRSEGRLASAEKLAGDAGLRIEQGVPPGPGDSASAAVGGFFVVRARDYSEATDIARASPHLKYGGSILIRRIEPT